MTKQNPFDEEEISFRPQRSEVQRQEIVEVNLQSRYNHLVQLWDQPDFEIPSFEAWCYAQRLDDSDAHSINDTFKDQDIFKIFEAIVIHLEPAKLSMSNQGNCLMSGMFYQQLFKMDSRYAKRIGDLLHHYSQTQPHV